MTKDKQNTTQKTKDRATRTPLKTGSVRVRVRVRVRVIKKSNSTVGL